MNAFFYSRHGVSNSRSKEDILHGIRDFGVDQVSEFQFDHVSGFPVDQNLKDVDTSPHYVLSVSSLVCMYQCSRCFHEI